MWNRWYLSHLWRFMMASSSGSFLNYRLLLVMSAFKLYHVTYSAVCFGQSSLYRGFGCWLSSRTDVRSFHPLVCKYRLLIHLFIQRFILCYIFYMRRLLPVSRSYGVRSIGVIWHRAWVTVRHGLIEASGGSSQSVRCSWRPLSIERLAGDRWASYVGCYPARCSVSIVWL